MAATSRRELIESRVLGHGEVDYASLAAELNVSEMTIRRDVDALESQGVVRRIIGGAIAVVGKTSEPTFKARAAEATAEKARIGAEAAKLLRPHETVILDSGSTVLTVAKAIKGLELSLTIITPSILVALELADEPNTRIFLTGGQIRPGELSLVGTEAEETFARYNCDTYMMGIAGVDMDRGVSEYHREESNVKRAAMKAADRTVVLADKTKLGEVQLMNVAPLSAISALVTDGSSEEPTLIAAKAAGVEVISVLDLNDRLEASP